MARAVAVDLDGKGRALQAELLAALGLKGSTFPIEVYRNGPRHVFVGLESVAALSALHPDHRALCDFPDLAVNCFAGAGRLKCSQVG
ncbi:PhzF family phenazine biosynthesis protein, partial [Pseudomonas aeruginosa]